MMRLLWVLALFLSIVASAQTRDVLGAHDMSSGASAVSGTMRNACLYCHAPHSSSGFAPLWSQTLSNSTYSLYASESIQNTTVQPPIGASSTLCLSCHDGTVAPGQTMPYGSFSMTGTMTSVMGTKLEGSHPFSLKTPLADSASLVASLASSGTTADPTKSVRLVEGNVECSSCHDPHNQTIDKRAAKFLVRDNANGGICLSCHQTSARTVNARQNPLVGWSASSHASSAAQFSPTAKLSAYATVGELACQSCHAPHNASAARSLLRSSATQLPNIDPVGQTCLVCHSGTDVLAVPLANVYGEMSKKGHPSPTPTTPHSAVEAVVVAENRHATCSDCHNPHASVKVTAFGDAPAIRSSQFGVPGVAADGTVLTGAAVNQYETCLRCHGASSGKKSLGDYLPLRAMFAGDAKNLIPQFNATATSAHPVMRDAAGRALNSLLRSMWDLSGQVQGRAIGTRIFCTDCHNSDNNREFGGTAPNGPHGSSNAHILERPYLTSQVSPGTWPAGGPGTLVTNLAPNPVLSPAGSPYALCAKCHDLARVTAPSSWMDHQRHITRGFSCSVCHTAHGVPAGTTGVDGSSMISFDLNVVGPNGGNLSYAGKTCVLACHMMNHNADGTVTPAQ